MVNATPLGKTEVTRLTGGWVGMMAGLDGKEKSRPNQGFEAQTNQPAASHYTD